MLRLCIWMPCGSGENAITVAFGTIKNHKRHVWNAFVGLPHCDSPTANTFYGTNENRFTFPMKQPFCGMADAGSADVGLRTHSMRPYSVWFMESVVRVSRAAAHHVCTDHSFILSNCRYFVSS